MPRHRGAWPVARRFLFGAQQTASEVERRVVANAALKVVGRLDAAEAERVSTASSRPPRARA